MECLYAPDLTTQSTIIDLSQEETRHAKVLRLRNGDAILISSGTGLLAKGHIQELSKDALRIGIDVIRENAHELPFSFGVMLPILSSKDRMEFAIEKLTELGISDFYPFMSSRIQTQSIDIERLQSKALSAMKQCKRSVLPTIHPVTDFSEISTITDRYAQVILGDVKGAKVFPSLQEMPIPNSILMCIGPEGGLSDEEVRTLQDYRHCMSIRIGNTRLRAESAAIALGSIIAFHYG
jgi:16S rRNA (uracil1498-N3)-methyltransferase